ncbi:hypothetical protein [Providencia rettgeri]|uniref:hypothetical protein n=1 Tax=Providencia rettgeri TaxID=587 RepID=UPI0039F57F65
MKNIDVLIIFEHVSRELETCLSLKFELEKLDLSCEIAPLHYNRYVTNIKYSPKLVVLPFLNSKDDFTLQKLREVHGEHIIGFNLHHEQLYNESTKDFMLPKDEYSRNIYHLAWTEHFKNDLISSNVAPDLVKVLCNPRFDSFWLKSYKNHPIKYDGFEEIIFFPTTFAWAFVSEDYFLALGNIEKDKFYRMKKITDETAQAYFKDIRRLAELYPQKLFLVRPHPYEDITYFRNKFLEYSHLKSLPDNIRIERIGNVYDWIKISNVTVGWCTTTNMEAAMCHKCSVIYHPVHYPIDMNLSFFNDFNILHSYSELEDVISGKNREKLPNSTLEQFSKEYGFPLKPVCPNIALWIDEILKAQHSHHPSPNKKMYFKNIFLCLIKDIPKYFLIKLKLIHIINKNYSGLYEDCVSYKNLYSSYFKFKECNK